MVLKPGGNAAGRKASVLLLALLAAGLYGGAASAEQHTALAANRVIYPGDILSREMLGEIENSAAPQGYGSFAEGMQLLAGKRAKRTLLPGKPISAADVENPRAVVSGSQVRMVFRESRMSILTSGLALQNGAAGDTVRVRNSDSGLTVSGIVLPDGSVAIGDR